MCFFAQNKTAQDTTKSQELENILWQQIGTATLAEKRQLLLAK